MAERNSREGEQRPAESGAAGDGAAARRGKDERAERLAAALRANLHRRKAARRAGLDDFGGAERDEDEV